MVCKKIYLGQELTQEDWDYGMGSIYLGGPRNYKGKSWRLDLIDKIESSVSNVCILIPETQNQLKGGANKMPPQEQFAWQQLAMSVASAILFWFPNGLFNIQSCVEFGAWHKSERVFLGHDGTFYGLEYMDWLLNKEQRLYPAESMDQLVSMAIHWIIE